MSGQCCSLIISNDFLTTLLTPSSTKCLDKINHQLTDTVLDVVCSTDSNVCIDPSRPDSLLYRTPICDRLAIINDLGITNEDIKILNTQHNVTWPWSIQYNSDRLGNNKRIQFFPTFILFPELPKDVIFWVRFAVDHGIDPSIRSGGFNFEGFSNSNRVVIDTTKLLLKRCSSKIEISVPENYVDVAPGVRLAALYCALNERNVIIAGGSSPAIAIGGLVAGGGVGYFLRQFGYSCDSLIEVDIVLASARKITCTANNEYSDLFRAIKGAGGGNFGIITRYRLQTHKVKKVIFFRYIFGNNNIVAVLDALQRVGIDAPDTLSGIVGRLTARGEGIIVNGVYNGKEDFNTVINKYFFSLIPGIIPIYSNVSYERLIGINLDLGFEVPATPFYKSRSTYQFELLSTDNIQTIVDAFSLLPITIEPMIIRLQYVVYGGYVNRVDPKSSVMVARAGTKGSYQITAYYSNPHDLQTAFDYVNSVYDVISSLTTTFADANISDLELNNPLVSYYGPDNVQFLIDVKTKYDPNNVFRFPQSIPVSNTN